MLTLPRLPDPPDTRQKPVRVVPRECRGIEAAIRLVLIQQPANQGRRMERRDARQFGNLVAARRAGGD